MSATAIEFHGIDKAFFGVPVLKSVSFHVEAGQAVGLIGENGAGKSTLMNILGGNHRPDAGRMMLFGSLYSPRNSHEAQAAGLAFIHQELNLFPNLSIAENIFISSFPRRGPLIDGKRAEARTRDLLEQVGLAVDPGTLVEQLSAGERQLVEIAKALSIDARLIIFDEPTTSLTARETAHLFGLITTLRGRGVTIIYISHVLADVLRLCDAIVVLRDGQVVGSGGKREFNHDRLVTLMVGRNITQMYPRRTFAPTCQPLLEARGLSRAGIASNITFTLHKQEVLGIAGLMGAGRSELARMLFGLEPIDGGAICLEGRALPPGGPRQRIERGMAFLTEDRREDGLCLEGSIAGNMAMASVRRFSGAPLRWIRSGKLQDELCEIRGRVGITPLAGNDQAVKTLSGGNQQKVVLAKWLLARPRVFILDEPTRGIDVGARHQIYALINDLAETGAGILVISSELEELIGLCDRILVMRNGAIVKEFPRERFDREQLLRCALWESA